MENAPKGFNGIKKHIHICRNPFTSCDYFHTKGITFAASCQTQCYAEGVMDGYQKFRLCGYSNFTMPNVCI